MKKWVVCLVAILALVALLLLVGWGLKSCQTPTVDNGTTEASEVEELGYKQIPQKMAEYCGAAEPPARWWRSHLSGLLEPPRLSTGYLAFSGSNP